MTVRIMTVCTGNICRSPYAHLTLQAALEQVRPGTFEVSSAGTGALIDNSVDPGSAHILDARGVPHEEFRARQISEQLNRAIVLHGDSADEELLLEENIDSADVFVAVTNAEEANALLRPHVLHGWSIG